MQIECHWSLTGDQAAQWQEFLTRSDHQHPRQDSRFAEIERADGAQPLFAIGRKQGAIVAVGLFSLRRHPIFRGASTHASCLSGPVCDDVSDLLSFLDGVTKHSAFRRCGRVKVTPYWLDAEAHELDERLAERGWKVSESDRFRHTGWIDLRPEPDAILGAFSKSARREVRRAERQGITLSQIKTDAEARAFLDSLNRLRTERGLGRLGQAAFHASFDSIYRTGDTGIIIGAYYDGALVSGILLYRSKNVAHGRHFTTEPDRLRTLSNLRIAPLVWFAAMKWARDRGCLNLDVEGWRVLEDENDKMYNVYKYKAEFRPRPVQRISERSLRLNWAYDVTGNGPGILKAAAKHMLRYIFRKENLHKKGAGLRSVE